MLFRPTRQIQLASVARADRSEKISCAALLCPGDLLLGTAIAAHLFQPRVGDAVTCFPDAANFFPDFFRRMKIEKFAFAHRAGEVADNFPVGLRFSRRLEWLCARAGCVARNS